MRAFRSGLSLALAATLALGACSAAPDNDGLVLASARTGSAGELDRQLDGVLTAMIASAEIDPDGKLQYNRALGDPRFLEPNSGRYWQVSGAGRDAVRSRSLWNRTLAVSGSKAWTEPLAYDSDQFPDEPLRIAERTVHLQGSDVEWQFAVAAARPR